MTDGQPQTSCARGQCPCPPVPRPERMLLLPRRQWSLQCLQCLQSIRPARRLTVNPHHDQSRALPPHPLCAELPHAARPPAPSVASR